MKRFMVCIAAAAVLSSVVPSVAIAEVNEITIAQQYGIAYLQFLVMQRDKLIEKHAKANGLGDVSVTWRKFAGSNVMYDAVFSGNLSSPPGGSAAAYRMGSDGDELQGPWHRGNEHDAVAA